MFIFFGYLKMGYLRKLYLEKGGLKTASQTGMAVFL